MIYTYIIETKENEFYVGKTENVDNRLYQHQKENKPHWFAFRNRKEWKSCYVIDEDVEKKIKSFGIKRFVSIMISFKQMTPLSKR